MPEDRVESPERAIAIAPDRVYIGVADPPRVAALTAELEARGLEVVPSSPAQVAWDAFIGGASAVVCDPLVGVSPEATWLAHHERVPVHPPILIVCLARPPHALIEVWLRAGVDDVLDLDAPAQAVAARIAGRVHAARRRRTEVLGDVLTGLGSREVFFDRLASSVAVAARSSSPMSMALVDIDGFRHIERELGRPEARDVLRAVASHLADSLRRSDVVARVGDDRFGLILHGITPAQSRRLLVALWRNLTPPPHLADRVAALAPKLTFTAGVACFPDDATACEELLSHAELALECARSSGHRRVLLFAETAGTTGRPAAAPSPELLRVRRGRRSDDMA